MDKTLKESIVRRIRALQEKTVANGCTEQEAMAAAEKVNDLLAEYGIAQTELDVRESPHALGAEDLTLATGKFRHPVQFALFGVQAFTETKMWFTEQEKNGGLRQILCIWGEPHDIEVARYLVQLIRGSIDREYQVYKIMHDRRSGPVNPWAFRNAMAKKVGVRLVQMKRARDAQVVANTGRSLVVLKEHQVEASFEQLGLKLNKRRHGGKVSGDHDAAKAGWAAGDQVALNPGLSDGTNGTGKLAAS